jgi:hypothetical protein
LDLENDMNTMTADELLEDARFPGLEDGEVEEEEEQHLCQHQEEEHHIDKLKHSINYYAAIGF